MWGRDYYSAARMEYVYGGLWVLRDELVREGKRRDRRGCVVKRWLGNGWRGWLEGTVWEEDGVGRRSWMVMGNDDVEWRS